MFLTSFPDFVLPWFSSSNIQIPSQRGTIPDIVAKMEVKEETATFLPVKKRTKLGYS
jgi:hypothetical protein